MSLNSVSFLSLLTQISNRLILLWKFYPYIPDFHEFILSFYSTTNIAPKKRCFWMLSILPRLFIQIQLKRQSSPLGILSQPFASIFSLSPPKYVIRFYAYQSLLDTFQNTFRKFLVDYYVQRFLLHISQNSIGVLAKPHSYLNISNYVRHANFFNLSVHHA